MAAKGLERGRFTTRAGAALELSRLGFGGAPLGNMHRALTEAEAEGVVRDAWNAGVRYFDTAPLYGHGLSEMRIGAVLARQLRDSYVVSTKVGRLLEPCAPGDEDSGIYRAVPPVRVRFDYTYDGVMRSHQSSLDRLGLDRIDILLVHDVDARTHGSRAASERRLRQLIDQGGWKALSELRQAGDVAAIGAGVNEWEPCARLLELADPDLFLLAGRYTLLEQAPLHSLFPACQARGVGVIIGGAFNSGVLVRGSSGDGAYDYGAVPPAIRARVEALEAVCAVHDVALPQAALAFVLAHPVVVSVIPGAQTTGELTANLAALSRPPPAPFWAELKARGLIDAASPTPADKVAA